MDPHWKPQDPHSWRGRNPSATDLSTCSKETQTLKVVINNLHGIRDVWTVIHTMSPLRITCCKQNIRLKWFQRPSVLVVVTDLNCRFDQNQGIWDFVCTETKALKMKHDCGDFKRDQQILWYFRHQGYSGLPLAWTINQAAYLLTSKIELKWHSVQVLWKDVTSTCPFLEEHVSRIFGHDFWCPASLKPERTHREVNKV